jgi:hypothetical protein
MSDEQSKIGGFTDEKSRPVLFKDAQVGPIHVLSKGDIYPGYRGPIPGRDAYGFVQFCERETHFHRNEAAYMLSYKVLEHLRSRGVELILIAEDDAGYVYEFHESQFDTEVPQRAKGTDEKDEDQRLVRVTHHQGKYADHASDVMVGPREVN